MATADTLLFSWSDVEELPELRRLEMVLDALPDEELVAALEAVRGQGRDDYPVRAMWRALVAGVVFGHRSVASLLRELGRNPALLAVCGFDPLPRQGRPRRTVERVEGGSRVVWLSAPRRDSVPSHWNFSRFVRRLVELERRAGVFEAMMRRMGEELREALPDFGEHLGYDGKAVASHSTGRVSGRTGSVSDRDADWGRHQTRGVDGRTGRAWTKVKSWFGYRVHLMADTRYEIPVSYRVERASRSEVKVLHQMVDEGLGEWAGRCRDFSADRGLDCGALKAKLWQSHGVRPLIEPRELWREEKAMPGHDPARPITRALYPERADCIVYTEKGQVRCRCPSTGEERDLAFWGFDRARNALKYRCPAAAHGFACEGRAACERMGGGQPGQYGRVVRIGLDRHDRRIFTPTPYGSPSWKRGYRRRAALERINARVDRSFEFEQHFIRGLSADANARGLGAVGDDGAGVGSGAGRAPGTDAFAVRPGSLGRHRLTGRFRPQVSPGPVPRARGRLVRVVRTSAFCPCTKVRSGVLRPAAGSIAPHRAVSSAPGAPGRRGPPARKPHSAHASDAADAGHGCRMRASVFSRRTPRAVGRFARETRGALAIPLRTGQEGAGLSRRFTGT